MGQQSQAHYAGANAFLDLLARGAGEAVFPPSASVGPWRDVGMMEEVTVATMQRFRPDGARSRENIAAL